MKVVIKLGGTLLEDQPARDAIAKTVGVRCAESCVDGGTWRRETSDPLPRRAWRRRAVLWAACAFPMSA